jgi:hypothetical protein
MPSTPVPPKRPGGRAPRAPVQQPDPTFDLLWLMARRFGADPASFVADLNSALELRAALHYGYYPARNSVPEPSQAMLAAAEVTDEAASYVLALGHASQSPNPLPAGLGIPGGEVGADSQMAALSEADEITSGEAAALLGLSSASASSSVSNRSMDGRTTRAGMSGMWSGPA